MQLAANPALRGALRHAGPLAPLHLVAAPRPGLDIDRLGAALSSRPGVHPGQLVVHRVGTSRRMADVAAEAAAQARSEGGVVLACGGDGTINAVAQAVWPLGVPMAALPGGTFNFFSRDRGLGEEPLAAFDRVLQALPDRQCRSAAVSLINDQLFIVNASIGLYPRLLAERERAKQRLGRHRWVAFAAGLVSLLQSHAPQQLTLVVCGSDGQVHERALTLASLFIGCNALQLDRLGLPNGGDASTGPAPMTALLLPPLDRAATARLVWLALRGRLPDDPSVATFECTELELHTATGSAHRRLRVAVDGESRWLQLPLRVSRAMRPLWLVDGGPSTEAQTG